MDLSLDSIASNDSLLPPLYDRDGYKLVESFSQRKLRKISNSAKELIGGSPILQDVFIGRIQRGNEETLRSYLLLNDIKVFRIEQVSRPGSWYKSFKASVNKEMLEKLTCAGFWPEGITCRVWQLKANHPNVSVQLNKKDRSNMKIKNTEFYNRNYWGKFDGLNSDQF